MSATYSKWRRTPWWLRLLGKPEWMRSRYASLMIGGGWDGWEFAGAPASEPCSNLQSAAFADGVEAAAQWHEAEAERIRLLALDSDEPRRFHEAQDDHLSHAAFIRERAALSKATPS